MSKKMALLQIINTNKATRILNQNRKRKALSSTSSSSLSMMSTALISSSSSSESESLIQLSAIAVTLLLILMAMSRATNSYKSVTGPDRLIVLVPLVIELGFGATDWIWVATWAWTEDVFPSAAALVGRAVECVVIVITLFWSGGILVWSVFTRLSKL